MIITIANQKGGVGKTTTALELGEVLLEKGFKVLFIDADKQCNLTATLKAQPTNSGTYSILANKEPAKDVIQEIEGHSVIAASKALANIDMLLADATGREYRLKESLEGIRGMFDFIIIDTPPSLSSTTVNALTATDYLIITNNADIYSLTGTADLYAVVQTVKKYTNKALTIGGILLTRYNGRSTISKDIKDMLEDTAKQYGTKVYSTVIRECVAIRESQTLKENLLEYAPKSNAAADYRALAEEIIADNKILLI